MKVKLGKAIALACLAILTVTPGCSGRRAAATRNDAVVVDIGPQPTQPVEERAALRRLSSEILLHPHANVYVIVAGQPQWRHGILGLRGVMGFVREGWGEFRGEPNIFWADSRFASPIFDLKRDRAIRALGLVSETPIHAAARSRGTVESMIYDNERLRVQSGLAPLSELTSPGRHPS